MLTPGRYHHPRKPPSLWAHLISEVVHTWKISLSRIHGVNHQNTAVLYYTKLAPAQNLTRTSFRSHSSSCGRPWIPISRRAGFAARLVLSAFFCFLVSIFFPFLTCLFPWQGSERSILLNDHWGKGSFLSSTLFPVVGFCAIQRFAFILAVTLISATENKPLLILVWYVVLILRRRRDSDVVCGLWERGRLWRTGLVLGEMGWDGRAGDGRTDGNDYVGC